MVSILELWPTDPITFDPNFQRDIQIGRLVCLLGGYYYTTPQIRSERQTQKKKAKNGWSNGTAHPHLFWYFPRSLTLEFQVGY